MRLIAAHILITLLLNVTAHAQSNVGISKLPKTYWLKYSLIFYSGCQPIVLSDSIIFTEGGCLKKSASCKILRRGAEVKLTSINKKERCAKVSFNYSSFDYEITLENESEKKFRKAFSLLFTEKKLDEFYDTKCPDHVKTKKQLIQCIGFPMLVTREGDVEKYHYSWEFVGFNSVGAGLDVFEVEIKNNKVIRVAGSI
jgi:hypothetical protein